MERIRITRRRVGIALWAVALVTGTVVVTGGAAQAAGQLSANAGGGSLPTQLSSGPEARWNEVSNVGGGTWSRGASAGIWNSSTCYSHYKHNSKEHTATAVLGQQSRTAVAPKGEWAKVDLTGSLWDTCNAYWNTRS